MIRTYFFNYGLSVIGSDAENTKIALGYYQSNEIAEWRAMHN